MKLRDTQFRVIAMRATGADPAKSGICEVAYADYSYAGVKARAEAFLLHPGQPIPAHVADSINLTDADVAECPYIDEIESWLYAPVNVAHGPQTNAFLKLPGRWLCTERLARHLYPQITWETLGDLQVALGAYPVIQAHVRAGSAYAEVASVAALFIRMLGDAGLLWRDITTVEQLAAKISGPALLKRFPFRDQKHVEFASASTRSLEWIVKHNAGGPDAVHTAKHYLSIHTYQHDAAES